MTAHGGMGGIVREACPGEAGKHFPEESILDDAHPTSQFHANPLLFCLDKILLQLQPCLVSHTDDVWACIRQGRLLL